MSKSIKKNFVMNTILTMSNFIFPLITFPYVSRVLLPSGTGKVAFATSVISYFSMFAQLGIPTYGIRACAQVRDDKYKLSKVVHELCIINFIMMLLSYLVFFGGIVFVERLRNEKILFVIMGSMILFNSIGMEWLYKALEEYTYITIRSIVFKAIAVSMMLIVVKSQGDYVIYGAISIFAASASNVMNCINAHKYITLKPIENYNFRQHIKPILIFFGMSCATTIYTNFDTVMLGFMKSDVDVGYYNAAIRIKSILVSIIMSLGTVLLPRAAYYIEHDLREEFNYIARKSINFVYIIALPMIIYFIVYAPECIYFLSGNAYEGSILPMQILMPTLLFIGLTNILGIQIMVPLEMEKWVLNSYIIGAIVDLIINILLIPKMGASGAAIGTLIAEIAVMIYQYSKAKTRVREMFSEVDYKKLVCALIIGTVLTLGIKKIHMGYFVVLVVSASVFFGCYVIVLRILKESMVCEIEEQLRAKWRKK